MRTLFFDFGDVLVFYDHMRSCIALAAHTAKTPEEIYRLIFESQLEEQHYNRGEYSDREWHALCCKKLSLRDCSYEVFAEKWGAIFSPNPHIGEVLGSLKPDVKLYVLSNTNGLHWAWAQKNLPVLAQYFPTLEQAILSSEEKSRKPEPLIFERALLRAGAKSSDSIFIDDKPINVDAFRKLGVRGIVYSAQTSPIAELKNQLREYGYI